MLAEKSGKSAMAENAAQLRIVSGCHDGAEAELENEDVILIGSASGCDWVLTDPGVADRHCLLVRLGGSWHLKALDSPVMFAAQALGQGLIRKLADGDEWTLGDAGIRIHLPANVTQVPRFWPIRVWWAALLLTLTLLIVLYTPRGETAAMPLVRKAPDFGAQMHAKETAKPAVATSDEWMAQSVREIFRLSGLEVDARGLSAGQVEIKGYFQMDDSRHAARVQAIADSRVMRDVTGLKKIHVVDLATPIKRPAIKKDAGKSFPVWSRVATGADPFVVDVNGSRYYPGALFPDGARLIAGESDRLEIVSTQGETQRVVAGVANPSKFSRHLQGSKNDEQN